MARHIPEFAAAGKEKITVRHLLTHQGGLVADNGLGDYDDGPEEAWKRIFAMTAPGRAGREVRLQRHGLYRAGRGGAARERAGPPPLQP